LGGLGIEEAHATAAAVCRGIAARRLLLADEAEREARCAARLAAFRAGNCEQEEEWNDGRWYQVINRRTASGNAVSLYFDITDRRQAEARLHRAQRMEAMGQLTGGIAHDFNNLLLVIIVSLDLLREVPDLEPPYPSLLENAHAAATRAADLTQRLLAFARQQPLRNASIDLGELVEGMHGLLKRTLGQTIGIEISAPLDLWPVANDQGQIENALLNLAINARDAMPRGGVLRIACFNHPGAPEEGMAPGDYVALAVTDTGEGMEPEVARRAFDPFFTTKPVGKGTGLGLSMIYGFVRQSGGHVGLATAPGQGTTVTLYLPRGGAEPSSPAEAAAIPEAGHESILVVEDDPDVRATAVQLIEQLGYSVLEAADGPAALELLRRHAEIALLFTDMVMPGGMRGDELAAAALALRPGIKVLISSGNADLGREPAGADLPDYPFIAKPYRAQALAQRLREALG
ncbi:ATP-binding protein, partial [Bosea sp. (in: a-proteobacteria)]|uniref:ATP-binding protein n=1 Tax=Bosea sp. (in: a-proteobacteria) TaxID=1871050 RepID=UPI0025C652C1